ncbi:MAG: TfoX/Sxy family protein [Methyloligellaceae bacterium]
MAWRKSPQSLIELFDGLVPDGNGIERRKMFGYPCAFVNGNMFTGLHQESMILRLSEADRALANETLGASAFEPMPGRPMREYIALPDDLLGDPPQLQEWMARSYAYAAALPVKQKKPRKARSRKS